MIVEPGCRGSTAVPSPPRGARTGPRCRFRAFARALLTLCLMLCGIAAHAHSLGESYVFLTVERSALFGRIEIPLAQLGDALFAGSVSDGVFSSEEVEENRQAIVDYVAARFAIADDTTVYPLQFGTVRVPPKAELPLVEITFAAEVMGEVPAALNVRYAVLFDVDPLHRGLLLVDSVEHTGYGNAGEQVALVFTGRDQDKLLDLHESSLGSLFGTYFEHGVYHIAIGADHIAFLVALLLASVLTRRGGRWTAVAGPRAAFINVVSIVTIFTVAHSITLGLAVLEIVTLPSRLVESMIALTVVIAAAHNLFPIMGRRMLLLVFVFGLFHGFGFAGVLADLGFREHGLAASLLGFNLGVEAGQLVLVVALFPVLYALRRTSMYVPGVLGFGSWLIAAAGAAWFLDRTMGLGA